MSPSLAISETLSREFGETLSLGIEYEIRRPNLYGALVPYQIKLIPSADGSHRNRERVSLIAREGLTDCERVSPTGQR